MLTTALSVVGATTPAASASAPASTRQDPPAISLQPDRGSATSAATVSLTASSKAKHGLAARSAAAQPVDTGKLSTSPYKMVAVTWTSGHPDVQVRHRSDQGWSEWIELEPLTDGPNAGDVEARGAKTQGSALMWVGPSDGVQVRSTVATGTQLVLIDPGTLASDRDTKRTTATPGAGATTTKTASATTTAKKRTRAKQAPMPKLRRRYIWKPNPDWLNGKPRYIKKVKQVHVHHTATANGYSRRDVPGLLRGMYRYHTQTLGWFDIGYNFLIDRFGRTWVGRSGGPKKRVRGAHTLGFNHESTGIAVIGNYQSQRVPARVLDAMFRLAAFKLDRDGNHAKGKVWVRSQGSDRFRSGRMVKLPRIDGHRDTNETACPGLQLYRKLPKIRRDTERRINYYD